MSAEDKQAKRYVLMHPSRYRIAKALGEAHSPMYIAEIAKKVGMDRKLASFHLLTLLENGLVTGRMQLAKPPSTKNAVAVKYYELTDVAREILAELK